MTEQQDNVYEANIETEQGATAQEVAAGGMSQETGSTALGKFKDVDALLKAYGCLQAEFTRRSQRIKELEKQVENLQETGASAALAEKLRKNAEARKAEEERFDAYIAEREQATEDFVGLADKADEQTHAGISGKIAENVHSEEENTSADAAVSAASGRGDDGLSSGELYERANKDEQVRLRIIGEYLSSVGKKGAPIVQGGAGALTAPPMKPRTIGEAGELALKMFKKSGAQA